MKSQFCLDDVAQNYQVFMLYTYHFGYIFSALSDISMVHSPDYKATKSLRNCIGRNTDLKKIVLPLYTTSDRITFPFFTNFVLLRPIYNTDVSDC